jgi:hypothetical protein
MSEAVVALLPKDDSGEALRQRPITLLSVIYRLWASTRVKDLIQWQENWIQACQGGFRPKHGPEQMVFKTALEIEAALLNDDPWCGIHFDYKKCYDQIPWQLVTYLADTMQMSNRIKNPTQLMNQTVYRRFKNGHGLGKRWKSTNGLLQGCPLSVVILNMIVQVWARALSIEIPEAIGRAFADDTAASCEKTETLKQVIDLTTTFADTTHQQLHPAKTITWATGNSNFKKEVKDITVQGTKINYSNHFRDLGAQLSTNSQNNLGCVGKRRKAALIDARKCASLPTNFTTKSNIVAAKPGSKNLYACEVTKMSKTARNTQRAAATTGCWGRKSKLRSPKIIMALLGPGPRMDPDLAIPVRAISLLRRTLAKYPETLPILQKSWTLRKRPRHLHAKLPGPIGI